ncbi:hypothetical protein AVEN_130422-1, partial [Araneus ventricosus]
AMELGRPSGMIISCLPANRKVMGSNLASKLGAFCTFLSDSEIVNHEFVCSVKAVSRCRIFPRQGTAGFDETVSPSMCP